MKITSIALREGMPLSPGLVTVIVGTNAVGKSTLLRETYAKASLEDPPPQFRWIDKVDVVEDDAAGAARRLMATLRPLVSGQGQPRQYHSFSAKNVLADVDASAVFDSGLYQRLKKTAKGESEQSLLDDRVYRRHFIAFFSCDQRLQTPSSAELTRLDQPPRNSLDVLYREPALLAELSAQLVQHFGRHLVLLTHLGSQLQLGVSPDPLPGRLKTHRSTRYARTEEWKEASDFSLLSEAGHGIRSYVNLHLGVLDPVNDVLLIDEPELFLFPSAKTQLGRGLVAAAVSRRKQILVVTHDATLLQGILDSGHDVQVLRLSFSSDGRREVFASDAPAAESRSSGKHREYLNAFFSQKALVVEGAADRTFYGGLLSERVAGEGIGFVVAGGKGGSKVAARLCNKVGISFSVILDFDAVSETLDIPLDIAEMRGASFRRSSWSTLVETAQDEASKTSLKRRGLGAPGLTRPTVGGLRRLLAKLRQYDVHVVPTGELESWCRLVKGARFSEDALEYFDRHPHDPQLRKVSDFLKRVIKGVA